jgi:hypothetical protein
LKAYEDQENAELLQPDVAMVFFDGLDNGRYGEFKKSILNGMTAGSVTQPATLNEMSDVIILLNLGLFSTFLSINFLTA